MEVKSTNNDPILGGAKIRYKHNTLIRFNHKGFIRPTKRSDLELLIVEGESAMGEIIPLISPSSIFNRIDEARYMSMITGLDINICRKIIAKGMKKFMGKIKYNKRVKFYGKRI